MRCARHGDRTFQLILSTLAVIGKKSQPEMFAHIQPHGHATAWLVRYFAAARVSDTKRWGLSLSELAFGAYIHDIGKYLLNSSVLLKPGSLSEEEYSAVSLHPIYGANVLSRFSEISDPIRRVVLHHHEHWDGNGYPDGLSGANIPIEARTIAVVDVYTSLRARRTYKPTRTKAESLELMKGMAGQKLDPCLTEDFITLIGGGTVSRIAAYPLS